MKGKIAYLILKYQQRDRRFEDTGPTLAIQAVNVCEVVGIPRVKALQFVEEILKDDMREFFAKFDQLKAETVLCDGDQKL